MLRNVDMKEISDGKLYTSNDMVKADSHNCEGCSACCRGMGNSIVLDPLDVFRLCTNLGKTPEKLLQGEIALDVYDGNILPYIKMAGREKGNETEEHCLFLNAEGRCSIHAFRPGMCRLFPLGRYYENGSFQYFLQTNECKKGNCSKIKVKKWLDTPDLKTYETYISDWHYFLKNIQEVLSGSDNEELIKNLNLFVLQKFFLVPYDGEKDFYSQFYARLEEARRLLAVTQE